MNSERIKEIQMATAYPNSVSVQQALLLVWNECQQEYNSQPPPRVSDAIAFADWIKSEGYELTDMGWVDADDDVVTSENLYLSFKGEL